ncbi:MAG: hypothetical protein K2I53_00715, partial [Lachnospiraceae bacterium]|nr:hypothetical protein [Lachnospiraceae bacterium]
MTISPIMGTSYYNPYAAYTPYTGSAASASSRPEQPAGSGDAEAAAAQGIPGASETSEDGRVVIRNPGESTEKQAGKKSSPAECETCKNRKYQDGSDEGDVSFKAPSHIDPKTAASKVRSHEQEHVSNAYQKAAKGNGKVVSCNVSIHTDICPECGRTYVSVGTTATQIKYFNEENPYQKEMKSSDA